MKKIEKIFLFLGIAIVTVIVGVLIGYWLHVAINLKP